MKLILALFIAALVVLNAPANLNIVNSGPKSQQVQAEMARKPSTSLKVSDSTPLDQEKAQTEPETVSQPETVAQASITSEVPPNVSQQGCEQYRPLIEQYNWDHRIALAVMQAESGCNPNATSPTADRGLMQINAVHADMVDYDLNRLFDPTTNVQVAYRVYLSQGWGGWSVYNSGRYLAFL